MKERFKSNSFIQTISNFPIFNYFDVFKLNLLKYESSFSIENIFIHCIHRRGQRKKIKVGKIQKGDFNWKHHPNQTKLEIKFNFTRNPYLLHEKIILFSINFSLQTQRLLEGLTPSLTPRLKLMIV